jgi:hypothetical protein
MRTPKRIWTLIWIVSLLVGTVPLAAQQNASTTAPAYRVLVVDGTKTLDSTMRVVGLASGIEQSGLADVTVLLADNLGSFDDPLVDRPLPEEPYDLVLIFPRGVDDGTAYTVWMLVGGQPGEAAGIEQALALLSEGIRTAFAGTLSAMGPTDDLWAGLTAALYVQRGWLR